MGSNPTGGMDVCLLYVLCCRVAVSAVSWSLVQRSPTDCGASLCIDQETSWYEEAIAHAGLHSQPERERERERERDKVIYF
jgi:hypothetical protein